VAHKKVYAQYFHPTGFGKMMTWNDVLPQFEAHLKQSELAQNTVAGYLHDVRSFALWLAECAGQEVSPSTFSSSDVEAYKQYLRDTLNRSPAGINRRLQSLRKFGRFALMAGIRDTNPVQGVRLLEGSALSAPKTLTELEIGRLVEVAQARHSRTPARDYAILQLLLQTGIRVSELVHLRLVDIEVSEDCGTLIIRGQGKRPERRVPLNEAAWNALRVYLDQPRPAEAFHLFLNRASKPLAIRSVQQIVASLGKAAGFGISAKTLRDTYAKLLWQDTGDLGLLTERLGHKRPEAALKYILPLAHNRVNNGGP
jgi:integrase/recombinase XerD